MRRSAKTSAASAEAIPRWPSSTTREVSRLTNVHIHAHAHGQATAATTTATTVSVLLELLLLMYMLLLLRWWKRLLHRWTMHKLRKRWHWHSVHSMAIHRWWSRNKRRPHRRVHSHRSNGSRVWRASHRLKRRRWVVVVSHVDGSTITKLLLCLFFAGYCCYGSDVFIIENDIVSCQDDCMIP